MIRVVKVEAHIDANTSTNTGRHTYVDFSRGGKTTIERKFVDVNTITVPVGYIETIEQSAKVLIIALDPLTNAKRIVTKCELDRSTERNAQTCTKRSPDTDKLTPFKIEAELRHGISDEIDIFTKQELEYFRRIAPDKLPCASPYAMETLTLHYGIGLILNTIICKS